MARMSLGGVGVARMSLGGVGVARRGQWLSPQESRSFILQGLEKSLVHGCIGWSAWPFTSSHGLRDRLSAYFVLSRGFFPGQEHH